MKMLIAYIPVLHQGYIEFIRKHPDATTLVIFGQSIIDRFDWLKRKEIRAIDPAIMASVIRSVTMLDVWLLDEVLASEIRRLDVHLVFANEEESREVAKTLFSGCNVTFENVFLRWDRSSITKEEEVSAFPVTSDNVHRIFMDEAEDARSLSSDWWRRVGGVLVTADGQKIVGYNKHVPSEHTPWVFGDPRNLLKRGIGIEITSALHVDSGLIAAAAARGISTKDARMYLTTFPCPFCSTVLAYSGLSELYFRDGYSVLKGAELMMSKGIKIFKVVNEKPSE